MTVQIGFETALKAPGSYSRFITCIREHINGSTYIDELICQNVDVHALTPPCSPQITHSYIHPPIISLINALIQSQICLYQHTSQWKYLEEIICQHQNWFMEARIHPCTHSSIKSCIKSPILPSFHAIIHALIHIMPSEHAHINILLSENIYSFLYLDILGRSPDRNSIHPCHQPSILSSVDQSTHPSTPIGLVHPCIH